MLVTDSPWTVSAVEERARTADRTLARTLTVQPRLIAKHLLQIVALLLVLDLAGIYLSQILHLDTIVVQKFVKHFDLNEESNIPAFFSSLLLLLASGLLLLIAKQTPSRRMSLRWLLLSLVFLFLAIDESTSIHEELTYTVGKLLAGSPSLGGYLRYGWVLPYTLALGVLTAFYARFIWQLSPLIRALFVLSGGLFVAGAVGLETIEGHYDYLYGMHNLYSSLLCTLEEVMEMSGVILFIYGLLTYIAQQQQGQIRLRVAEPA